MTSLAKNWSSVLIKEVGTVNPGRTPRLVRAVDSPTSFIPMAAVDERFGVVRQPIVRPFGEVQKGYTYFENRDVIFAKITPCMQNGKSAICQDLTDGIGFGSTEFHVIRPGPQLSPRWLHFFLRRPELLHDATRHFTGSVGQQRLPADYLSELQIPLPPLAEQERIAAWLTAGMAEVEQARQAAQARLAAAEALPAAILGEAFDLLEKAAPKRRLEDISGIVSGITLGKRAHATNGKQVPYLRVANVQDGFLSLDDIYQIRATDDEIEKLRLVRGDLILTEGGDRDKLGRGTWWNDELPDCVHQNHIFRVRFADGTVDHEFLSYQLRSPYGKAYFLAHAKQTTGIATINQRVLRAFPVLLPPLAEQRHVSEALVRKMKDAEQLNISLRNELSAIGALPAALLRQAFGSDRGAVDE